MNTRILVLAGLASLGAVTVAAAEEVRLRGPSPVVARVVNPHRAAVERAPGTPLTIVGNATGRGLVDLADGRCDASLVSEPMDIDQPAPGGIANDGERVAG